MPDAVRPWWAAAGRDIASSSFARGSHEPKLANKDHSVHLLSNETRHFGAQRRVPTPTNGLASPLLGAMRSGSRPAEEGGRRRTPTSSMAAARATITRPAGPGAPPDARLEQRYALFVSLPVVPIFAMANLRTRLDLPPLRRAFTGPITWGIVCGLAVGKPAAYVLVPGASRALGRAQLTMSTVALHGGAFEDPVLGRPRGAADRALVAVGLGPSRQATTRRH
jgi:hypothetical protein